MEMIRNELQFYSKFARPLIFQLPDAKDRVLASGWVKKIRDEQMGSEKLRTDYIKLLLFALQRKKLVGIFAEDPEHYEKLEEFPQEFDLNAMAKNLIQKEQFERIDRIRRQLRGQIGDSPPYMTDCSSDFREYVAAQDIPGFGVHCYYAISKEPIDTWRKADKGIFPKMAKSAVDTSSSAPPGVAGKSSEPCICPLGAGEPDPSCKARVHKGDSKMKKKKRPKSLGKNPPSHPLGHAAPPEDREPPSWSSNLMEVKDTAGKAAEIAPATSTGAIPKRKGERRLKIPVKLDDSDMVGDDFKEMEGALEDYKRGTLKPRRQKKQARQKQQIVEDTSDDKEEAEIPPVQDLVPFDENFDDIDQSQYQDEVDQDRRLLKYFKGKIAQSGVKQRLAERNRQVRGACPAKSGIPLTTPRPSVIPKRQKSSEKLYEHEEHLPHLTESPGKGQHKHPTSNLKDPEVYKLFDEASALVSRDDDQEFQQLEQFFAGDEGQAAAFAGMDADSEYQQLLEKEEQQKQALFEEPPAPIQKGSPQANAIFSEAMDTLQGESPLGLSDDWFEKMDTGATGFLQGDIPQTYNIPEDYGGHGLPELISVQPNISPYKPYRPELIPAQREQIHHGTPPQSPRDVFHTPSPSVKPTSPVYSGSQSPSDPLGYVTPEHLKIKRAERQPIPQIRSPPSARPPRSSSPPPQAARGSPQASYRSPREIQLPPIGDEQDSFFFDMAMEQPPIYASPEQSPERPNMLTVREAPPRLNQVISDILPQNVYAAEPLDEANMAQILEGASDADIFGEYQPALEEGVDPLDDLLDVDNDYVPTYKVIRKKREPVPMEDMSDVGFSLAKTIRATERRSDTTYKSPEQQKMIAPTRAEISEQERRYIDYLFPEDQDMNLLIKRVSGMVADVEQDFPDPYHVMPASPEFPDVGDGDLNQETSPGLDYYSSPEPSPVAAPPQAPSIQAPSAGSGIPQPGQQTARPTGIRPPGARGIPRPKGAIPRPSGGIPRPSGGIPRPSGGIPRPAGAGPRPTGALPRPAGAGPRPAGAGSRPAEAGPRPAEQQPSQARPAAPRPPKYSKQPQYFPATQMITDQWPHMSMGFQRDMRNYQIDENVLDANRQRMRSRQVLVGPTAGRRHDIRKRFRPTDIIQEHPDEPDLTPRKYGPCGVVAMPPRSPEVFAGPPTYEEMVASYIPPMYVSPGDGILEVTPPFIDVEEDRELKRELLYDETKERDPIDMKHFGRMHGRRQTENEQLMSEMEQYLESAPEPIQRRVVPRQPTPSPRPTLERQDTPEQSAAELYIATPTPMGERRRRDGQRKRSRLPPGLRTRRIDFDERDPDIVTETDKYIEEKMAQHQIVLTPPEPASVSPIQYGILDEQIPPDVRLPPPIRAPAHVEGWRTPPWLSRRPKPPPPFQAKLPPVDRNQWFFQTEASPEFPASPPGSPGLHAYDLGTPDMFQGGGQMGGLFFDDPNELPPLPNLGPSPEQNIITCGSPILAPVEAMPNIGLPPSHREMRTQQRRVSPAAQQRRVSPAAQQRPVSPATPKRSVSPCTPPVGDVTPLGSFSGNLLTPSPDAHMKTPVTSARKIFQAAGVEESPLRYNPLDYPLAMEEMKQRVVEAEGRRGIRTIREQAALPRQQRPPPQHTRPRSGVRQQLQQRWVEQEDFLDDPEPRPKMPKRRSVMPRIWEDGTPPPPVRVPTTPRPRPLPLAQRPQPRSPQDPYGLPKVLNFVPPRRTREGPTQMIPTMPQETRELPQERFDSPQQDVFLDNERYVQEVMSRQNLPPLSPQRPISPLKQPSPSWEPDYDLAMPQVDEGYFLDQNELEDMAASPEQASPGPGTPGPSHGITMATCGSPRGYMPDSFFEENMNRTESPGPSHGITMATCGSPRGYMPDSFMEESMNRTESPGPSHGITMATCGSPRGYMPDSFLERSPLSPPFTPPPGADFRTPDRPIRAEDIFRSAGIQDSPKRPPTPSPTMQEMISRVNQAQGRRGVRRIQEQRGAYQAAPQGPSLRDHLRKSWSMEFEDVGGVPRDTIVRKRPGPPSMPTVQEQTPPLDQYGLPAIERAAQPARVDPYYSPPPQPQTPRSRRDVLPEDPAMQRAIDSLRTGQPVDLDAIQVEGPVQQLPQSPCSPTTVPGYRTPEHLRIKPQSPFRPPPQRSPIRVRIPAQMSPQANVPSNFTNIEQAFQRREEKRTPPVLDTGFLVGESPDYDFPQSPPQVRSPEHFRDAGAGGGMLFDQQMEAPQYESPPPSGNSPQQDRFGLPNLVQLGPPRDIRLSPLRTPMAASARTPQRSPSPCAPIVSARTPQRSQSPCSPVDEAPIFPAHETSFESPVYAGHLKLSQCRGAMIEPMQDIHLSLPNSPEMSPGRWQQLVAVGPGEEDQGGWTDASPDILQASPRSQSGSPSPDRVVSQSASQKRCITARRLDL
ncbi:unnamed protein product [Phaedon cochleariae]|uniref:DUF4485 domain-containing protein n=1 Tax=Phaedon cochleariae TaxID=80249 RepID=A0A9N9SAU6_PHACE|nr:unnamed protein product [Phaedon cochleariae]